MQEDNFQNYQGDEFGQQPQQFVQPTYPIAKRFDGEFTRWQFDTSDILMEIENFLRGKVKNEDGDYKDVYKPLASMEGINLLMGDLRFHLHKGIFLSNLSKDDVKRIAYQTSKMVIQWVYLGWKKYDIDEANFNRIVYDIDHTVFCSLMKPMDDRERKHLSQTTSRNEQVLITSQDKQKRFGLF